MDYVIETRDLQKVNDLVKKGYTIHSTFPKRSDVCITCNDNDIIYVLHKYPYSTQGRLI